MPHTGAVNKAMLRSSGTSGESEGAAGMSFEEIGFQLLPARKPAPHFQQPETYIESSCA